LGALILSISLCVAKSVFEYFKINLPGIYAQIGFSACFFIGPFLYFFLRAAVEGRQSMPASWKYVLLGHAALIVVLGIIFPYSSNPDAWCVYLVRGIFAQWFFFLGIAAIPMRERIGKLIFSSDSLTGQDKWLLSIYGGNLVILLFYFLSLIHAPFTTCLNGSIVFSFMLYLIITILLYRKKTDDLFQFVPEKTKEKKFDDTLARALLEKLEKLMIDQEIFKDPELKLSTLASRVGIPPYHLSALLNDHLEQNFTSFVNGYRVAEACRVLRSDHRLTLESVGYEVGFNSKSTFFAAFKKQMGMTPLAYQQQPALS
jgi:AraC-like DNA-binding protein